MAACRGLESVWRNKKSVLRTKGGKQEIHNEEKNTMSQTVIKSPERDIDLDFDVIYIIDLRC